MLRLSVLFLAAVMLTDVTIAAGQSGFAGSLYAQYYPPGYGYAPLSSRPPCEAVTPGPLQGRPYRSDFGECRTGRCNRGRLRRSPRCSTPGFGAQCGRMLLRDDRLPSEIGSSRF